ncbi:MAG TPA: RNA repair domain-containing protein [Candidatus Thermoplasmatota archaeon]|nr:RNA repair domain-containing protein [Candidatus Thermoplasmatota archaeon]
MRLVIRHRGAPQDEKAVVGSPITDLGASFFEVDAETRIPYHRIQRIYHRGAVVYERVASSEKSS